MNVVEYDQLFPTPEDKIRDSQKKYEKNNKVESGGIHIPSFNDIIAMCKDMLTGELRKEKLTADERASL